MKTYPKVLGLTLYPKLTYSTYIHNISVQAHKPLQMIKALTATGWGKQKEALEYASSIWSPLASSTSFNKLPFVQNAALRTATGCTQNTNIYMTEHSYFPYANTYSSTHHNTKQKTQHPSHSLHKHTTYFNTQTQKKPTIFTNDCYTTNIPTDPHKITTTDIKPNMRYIHTSIVSRHLATRSNNKIRRTPPPHISSSEEILPRLTRLTLAQLRPNKSPFLKSYLHKVDANHIHHHYAPSVTLTPTTHIISSTAPTYAPHCHRGFVGTPCRSDCQMVGKAAGGPQVGRSDSPH